MRKYSFILFLCSTFYYLFAQEKTSTHYSPIFSANDAKSIALGGLGVATLPDDFSLFHNAGKYIFLTDELAAKNNLIYHIGGVGFSNTYFPSVNLNHTTLSAGTLVTPFMAVSAGFSLATHGIYLTNANERNFGDFSFAVAPSFKLVKTEKHKLSAGFLLRYYADVSQREYLQSFAMDVGFFYHFLAYKDRTQKENFAAHELTFGLSLQNLFGKIAGKNIDILRPFLPATLRLAHSEYFYFKNKHSFSLHYELQKPMINNNTSSEADVFTALQGTFWTPSAAQYFGTMTHHLGTEFAYRNQFAFRLGALLMPEKYGLNSAINAGFSFKYRAVDLGFAYTFPLGARNYLGQGFSLTGSWNFKHKS